MFVKNSNFVIYLTLALLVGFGASALLFSGSQSSLLSGDISKATRYNNVKEDPAMSALEEKLQNDTAFFNLTKKAYGLIGLRVYDLEDLTSRTIELCSDIPEFKIAIRNVVSLNAKAYNTTQALSIAATGLQKLSEGKKAPEYEQASSNVYVGFQKIEAQLAIGKAFVDTAVEYLKGKDENEASEIANLVAEWSVYCVQDAMLNSKDSEISYWEEKYGKLTENSPAMTDAYKNLFDNAAVLSASETFLQGASETFLQGASETFLQGASETFLQGAIETFLQGASENFLQGASETFLQGASETFLQGASETFLQGAQFTPGVSQ